MWSVVASDSKESSERFEGESYGLERAIVYLLNSAPSAVSWGFVFGAEIPRSP